MKGSKTSRTLAIPEKNSDYHPAIHGPIPLARPDIGQSELDAIQNVLESGQLSRGSALAAFEKAATEQIGAIEAVAVSSGTGGLILALQALGVKAGDEVITVAYTVPATLNAIVALGAVPVLVDIQEHNRGLDPRALAAAITRRTAAVIPVHAFGQAASMEAIMRICQDTGVPVLEDACEAFGNHFNGQALGSLGAAGVFGFYPNKQLTTGEGGLIVTRDHDLAIKIRRLRNNGRTMNGQWLDQAYFGWNFRLDEMSAALGMAQLRQLPQRLAARRQVANWYDETFDAYLPDIRRPLFTRQEAGNTWFAYVVHIPEHRLGLSPPGRFADMDHAMQCVVEKMRAAGIQCGRYFAPLHRQPAFLKQYEPRSLPVTDRLAVSGLALPFYPQLTKAQVKYVVSTLSRLLCHE